jgi:hypothetical protein
MASKTFNPFGATAKPKVVRTRDALDVAARYFVYKLYDVTRRDETQWVPLKGIPGRAFSYLLSINFSPAVAQGFFFAADWPSSAAAACNTLGMGAGPTATWPPSQGSPVRTWRGQAQRI